MEEGTTPVVSHFGAAPPRGFILPAILLLLSERPGYGYGLVPQLQELHFDHVDRPAVYRALSLLERDGLAEPSPENPRAGQARRVYRITPLGERVLREWMAVVKDEHDHLHQVLQRYQATGTVDAVLAEIGGGWSSALSGPWSAVSSTAVGFPQLVCVDEVVPAPTFARGRDRSDRRQQRHRRDEALGGRAGRTQRAAVRQFCLVPDRSAILIDVRSSVGPLSFGTVGVTGSADAAVQGGRLHAPVTSAGLEVDMRRLQSGNRFYDAELLRRIESDRFPRAAVELTGCRRQDSDDTYLLQGKLTFHRVARPVQGTVTVKASSDDRLVISGEQVFDMRDFGIPSPTVLMLRIYPDVRVRLHAEARVTAAQ